MRLEEQIPWPGNTVIHRLVESVLCVCPVVAEEAPLGHRENCLRLVKRRIDADATTVVRINKVGQIAWKQVLEVRDLPDGGNSNTRNSSLFQHSGCRIPIHA